MREWQSLAGNRKNILFWIVLAIAIATGIFFRLYNLDKKVFWFDETISANHISGHGYEWYYFLKSGKPVEVKDLLTFQAPDERLGLKDSVNTLIELEPIHTPLFFCLLYFWAKFVGCSVLKLRLLPALISLLQIPATFWLCFELSGTLFLGMLAAALLSLSPVLVLYAQETREYSLFASATLILSASFLRAVRKQNLKSWTTYTLALIFALYTSLLTFFVIGSQLIYLLLHKGWRWKQFRNLFAAWAVAIIVFLPWLRVLWEHYERAAQVIQWLKHQSSVSDLLEIWNINFANTFLDLGKYDLPFQLLMGAIVLVEMYAVIELSRKSRRVAKFLLPLIATSTLPFMICDFIVGGRYSTPPRYQIAATIGIIISIAYLFYMKLREKTRFKRMSWAVVFSMLLLGELVSCAIMSQATGWRTKSVGGNVAGIAEVLNRDYSSSLLLTEDDDAHLNSRQMLVFCHILNPTTKVLLLKQPTIPQLDPETTHFYAYRLTPTYQQYLQQTGHFNFVQVDNLHNLQRVECK
jgi:uncharacterized membrane protein